MSRYRKLTDTDEKCSFYKNTKVYNDTYNEFVKIYESAYPKFTPGGALVGSKAIKDKLARSWKTMADTINSKNQGKINLWKQKLDKLFNVVKC